MAKVTTEYIRRAFYRQFKALSPARREGIIEALEVLNEAADDQSEPDSEAPLLEGQVSA